jgi:hypothetical protein
MAALVGTETNVRVRLPVWEHPPGVGAGRGGEDDHVAMSLAGWLPSSIGDATVYCLFRKQARLPPWRPDGVG